VPSTPLSMMMELKGWLRTNVSKVEMIETANVSKISYNFINLKDEDEKSNIASFVSD
jgi:hypothetical protein